MIVRRRLLWGFLIVCLVIPILVGCKKKKQDLPIPPPSPAPVEQVQQVRRASTFQNAQIPIQGLTAIQWKPEAIIPVSVLLDLQDTVTQLATLIKEQDITSPGQLLPAISNLPKNNPLLSGTTMKDVSIRHYIRYSTDETLTFVGGAYLQEMLTNIQSSNKVTGNNLVVTLSGMTTTLVITNTTDHTIKLGQGERMTYLEPGSIFFIELRQAPIIQGFEVRFGSHPIHNESFSRQQSRDSVSPTDYPPSFPNNFYEGPRLTVFPGTGYTLGLQTPVEDFTNKLAHIGIYQVVDASLSNQDQVDFGLTGTTNILSHEDRTTYIGMDKMSTILYSQPAYIPLSGMTQHIASGTLSFTLPQGEGSYIVYMRDTNGFSYTFRLVTQANFAPTIQDDKDNMVLTLSANLPFDKASVQQQFEQRLGTGKVDIAATDPYERELQVSYRIPPKMEITEKVDLSSIFGQTTVNYITLFLPQIPEQFQQRQIFGGTINLLPSKGYRGSRLELGYKNIFKFSLYFQACKRSIPNVKQSGYLVEQLLYSCTGPLYTYAIDRKNPERWRLYDEEIQIPVQLNEASHFRVGFTPNMENTTYFSRTNMGMLGKISDNQQLSLRGFTFDTGKPAPEATVTVRDQAGQQLFSGIMYTGFSLIDLSKFTQAENNLVMVDLKTTTDESVLVLSKRGDSRRSRQRDNEYYGYEYGSYIHTNELYSSEIGYGRGWSDGTLMKVYGYTDRGLYKPGDTINFAGFVRDLGQIGTTAHIPKGSIRVVLNDQQGQQIDSHVFSGTDSYGAFHGNFTLPTTTQLGTYYMLYEFEGQQSRSHDLRVLEFQKASFEVKPKLQQSGTLLSLIVEPTYYFGSLVDSYDLDIDRSISGKDSCRRCRWRNEDEYYFNHVFGQSITTGDSLGFLQVGSGQFAYRLLDLQDLPNRGYTFTLRADLRIQDRLSDETQFESLSQEVVPAVKIGLKGQPEERVYQTGAKIEGTIQDPDTLATHATYRWYYESFATQYQYGVDGNRYVVDGHQMEEISSGAIEQTTFQLTSPLKEAGNYLLRIVATDKKGNVLGETQKRLSYYHRDAQWFAHQGNLTNNYKLTVNIPKKSYTDGETIPIDIEPYISGATALVTVEKGKQIVDTFMTILTGKQLHIIVKPGYYPNIHVNVTQIAGENLSLSKKRREPRFFVGYAQAEIEQETVVLQIETTTDKPVYQPGEIATITLRTKDSAGIPTNAQLSVAVIDKALLDIYHLIKEPLPAFYNKMPSLVSTFTNMKFLYQALKVFSAEGSKGGGGGGGLGSFGNIRKQLLDLALRQPAVQTKNGVATIQMTIPDNLTTRVIDVIGITQDAKLGTTTSSFVVKKPLLIEANLPTFLTYGDTIQLPIKVITPQPSSIPPQTSLNVEGVIKTEDGRSFSLGKLVTKPNTGVMLPLKVPAQVWNHQSLILEISVIGGGAQDAVRQTIPLRTAGFISHDYFVALAATGSHAFTGKKIRQGTVEISLAPLPINAFEQVLDYLLHYPYGCSEQLMSSLYPLVVTKQLSDIGLLGDRYINNQQQIKLPHSTQWQDLDTVVKNGLYQLFANQQSYGGFGYRQGGNAEYALSAYIYGALLQIQKTIPDAMDGLNDKVVQLEEYLTSNGTSFPEQYLYYLRQRATNNQQVNINEVRQLVANKAIESSLAHVLAFDIAVSLDQKTRAKELMAKIDRQALGTIDQEAYGYGVYTDGLILQAIYLRGLLKFDSTHPEIKSIVRHLLHQRDSQGIWSRSTQRNVQIMLALGDYLQTIQNDGPISCVYTIGEVTYTGKLLGTESLMLNTSQEIQNTSGVSLKWMCTKEVIGEIELSYLPEDLATIPDELHQVTLFEATIDDNQTPIGKLTKLNGSFQVSQDARQVAIEFFIPSTFKFLETIKKQQQNEQQPRDWSAYPFTVKGGRACSPTHREIRFDRLFLYYDTLKTGNKCDVSIPILKAYTGTPQIMPARLWEMYQTTVRGRVRPKIK